MGPAAGPVGVDSIFNCGGGHAKVGRLGAAATLVALLWAPTAAASEWWFVTPYPDYPAQTLVWVNPTEQAVVVMVETGTYALGFHVDLVGTQDATGSTVEEVIVPARGSAELVYPSARWLGFYARAYAPGVELFHFNHEPGYALSAHRVPWASQLSKTQLLVAADIESHKEVSLIGTSPTTLTTAYATTTSGTYTLDTRSIARHAEWPSKVDPMIVTAGEAFGASYHIHGSPYGYVADTLAVQKQWGHRFATCLPTGAVGSLQIAATETGVTKIRVKRTSPDPLRQLLLDLEDMNPIVLNVRGQGAQMPVFDGVFVESDRPIAVSVLASFGGYGARQGGLATLWPLDGHSDLHTVHVPAGR
jgi:hypothetical protein